MTERGMIEQSAGAGFSDWQRAARATGNYALLATIKDMDGQPGRNGENSHHFIHQKLGELSLPRQHCLFMPLGIFLEQPENHLAELPAGDYYFASIKPGTHLAHGDTSEQVINFMQQYRDAHPEDISREVMISHNGEAAMSGHIIIRDDGQPNSIDAEFTIGNFNAFHRGFHTPEISLNRTLHAYEWQFRGTLATDGDWRTDEQFRCFGDVYLSRIEMARSALRALHHIPHDDDVYLPGYYEVLFEKIDDRSTRPVFIEAVTY